MRSRLLLGMIAILWIGMILAVGMESIVKFDTPSLSKAVAFDEGRYVFSFFNKVQLILLASMLFLVANKYMTWVEKIVFFLLSILLVIQVFWLFPMLSKHVDLILAGIQPPHTPGHALYGAIEFGKIILLSVLGFRVLLHFGN